MSEQIRQAILEAVLDSYPHEDPPSLPAGAPARYAVVQEFRDGSSFWIDLCDEPEEKLLACAADFTNSGYEPILVVDLDDGSTRAVIDYAICHEVFPDGLLAAVQTARALVALREPAPRGRISDLAMPASLRLPSSQHEEEISA